MQDTTPNDAKPAGPLRTGWTTGACATAAARAAVEALWTGAFPDPVTIVLPGGASVSFALAEQALVPGAATAAIVKDAGDDPDVTHGALVVATVSMGEPGRGVTSKPSGSRTNTDCPAVCICAQRPQKTVTTWLWARP